MAGSGGFVARSTQRIERGEGGVLRLRYEQDGCAVGFRNRLQNRNNKNYQQHAWHRFGFGSSAGIGLPQVIRSNDFSLAYSTMDESNEESSATGIEEPLIVDSLSFDSKDMKMIQLGTKKGWTPEVEPKPKVGLKFRNYHEAYVFYKEYAKKAGFEVRKTTSIKMASGAGYSHKYVVCAKEGKKAMVAMPSIIYGKNRPQNCTSPRMEYKAMIKFKFIRENCYEIYHYKHGPNKAFNVLKQSRGGYDKVGVTVVDCKIFKRDLIAFVGENNADMVVNKLLKKQEYLTDLSFQYLVDIHGTLTGLFWADEEAKRNYQAFGDVVGFDATFRTNKYFMVFVPFTGTDNHKRCVTFGGGLLSSETIESYETDNCPSLKQAIPKVYPNVKHRLCMWHICNKFADKLGSNLANTGILKQLNDIVWDDQISVLILNQNEVQYWISTIYKTTSRSEGENYFFGLISNVDLHLIEFLNNFDTAMEAQRCVQRKNDHDSRYTNPDLKCQTRIERDASQLFTMTVFYEIQGEMIASMMKCMSTSVSYNKSDGSILCSCNRYVLHGTLCRHCFYVFRMLAIDEFPKKYVLTRWMKDVVTRMNSDKSANRNKMLGVGDELNSKVRDIYGIVDSCVDLLVSNIEDLSLYKDKQEQLKKDVETNTSVMPPMSNREVIASYYGVTSNKEITLKTPKGIRNKGCGPHKKRIISDKEKAIDKSKKSRTCSLCGIPSHNARSVHKFSAVAASK
ncbi:hypothetical protein LXL04_023065 [Taraxacum kok-saghyz]